MGQWATDQFEESRPRLRAIAVRMLGSQAEADDAVQEAWLRLHRAGPDGIDNLGGWLTTVVSRVCLDMLRARRSRHEDPAGDAMAESAAGSADGGDPEHELLLADSIGPALAVVLDSLEPDQRLAFVLHDLFAVPFAEIAPIVGRSPAATRQLASRARRRLQGPPAPPARGGRTPPDRTELTEAFLAAARQGDFEGLVALLDPDVVLRADPVAVRAAAARQAHGAPKLDGEHRGRDAVARIFAGRAAVAQVALVNGVPAAVWAVDGQPRGVFLLRWSGSAIVEIEIVVDPRRLRALDVAL